jgi:predicted Ser/Thr protein kinase
VCRNPLDHDLSSCPECGATAGTGSAASADAHNDAIRHNVQKALGDEYSLLSTLGRGGMGVVYLARQRGLERLVAVKVLSPTIATPEGRERFRREARMAAGLTHPAILPVYAFGEAEEIPFIVMGYVRSETLADQLRHERRLPLERARKILADLASALDYAHRHGVIHRDIKPENILLEDESDRALLMDFGIAKSHSTIGGMTATGVAVGTPKYMSPEQAVGDRKMDGRSDIFSLGLVAYEMLAGYAPFAGHGEKFLGPMQSGVTPLSDAAPDVPDDLAMAVMRCLAPNPEDRWPDARSFGLAVTRGNAEAGVPDELREIAGYGSYALLWVVVWGIMTARAYADGTGSVMLLLSTLLVPVGFALQAWNIRRAGFSIRQIVRTGLWPPKWWGLWWPRALRRPDDMWLALPQSARVGRVGLTAFFVATPGLAYIERLAASSGATADTLGALRTTEYMLIAAATAGIGLLAVRWKSRGMSTDQLARLLVGSTTGGTFWRQPQISPLLQQTDGGAKTSPTSPHEYLRAVSDAAEALAGSARAQGSEAVAAARTLLAAIEDLDRQLDALRRDADPVEVMRVQERFAVIGEGHGSGDDDMEQMRELLRRQLDVFSRLGARHELVSDQRGHVFDQLQLLWSSVRQLGREDATPTARASCLEALRAQCLGIERRAQIEIKSGDVAMPSPAHSS